MARRGYSKRRIALWNNNPHCSYCGVLTVLPEGRERLSENHATIEHIYPKLHPLRQTPNTTGEQRLILACYRCNNEKSVRDQSDYLSPESLRLRSMGKKNWKSWAEARLKDLARFDCF